MGPEDCAKEYEWWKFMRRRPPSLKDMNSLQERCTSAEAVAYEFGTVKTAKRDRNFLEGVYFNGVTFEYNQTITVKLSNGRYFSQP